jgi:hypothetical protein
MKAPAASYGLSISRGGGFLFFLMTGAKLRGNRGFYLKYFGIIKYILDLVKGGLGMGYNFTEE